MLSISSPLFLGCVFLVAKVSLVDASIQKKPVHVDKTGCPNSKGCFSFPEECNNDQYCDYLLTYIPSEDKISFAVSGKGEYVAFGFNDKPEMDGTDTVICFKSRIGLTIAHFSIVGHDTPKYNASNHLSLAPPGMRGTGISLDDGVIKCSFERQKAPTKYMKYDLNKELYLIFARGPVNNEFIQEHTWKDVSWKKVNISQTLRVEGEEFDLLLAHGGLMFLAWIGFATVGMFTSRYRKDSWGEKKLFNSKIWFRVHQGCMFSTILLSIIAFILIFVDIGEWAEGAHPIIGIFTMVFMIIQPIMAFFRPEPQAYSRFLFTWAHRFVGVAAFLFALVNCYLGINMVPEIKDQGNAILSIFLVVMVIVILLYEVFLFRGNKKTLSPFSVESDGQDNVEINTPADQVVHDEPATPQTTTEKHYSTLREVVYYFVVVLCAVLCLAFIIVFGTAHE